MGTAVYSRAGDKNFQGNSIISDNVVPAVGETYRYECESNRCRLCKRGCDSFNGGRVIDEWLCERYAYRVPLKTFVGSQATNGRSRLLRDLCTLRTLRCFEDADRSKLTALLQETIPRALICSTFQPSNRKYDTVHIFLDHVSRITVIIEKRNRFVMLHDVNLSTKK